MDNPLIVKDGGKISSGIGTAGLYLFALGAWLSAPLANVGMGLMCAALLVRMPVVFPFILRDRLFIVSSIFGVYLFCRTFFSIWELPGSRGDQIDGAWDLFRLGFITIVIVGYWLAGNGRRVYHVLLLALGGFLMRIAVKFEDVHLSAFLAGERAQVGMPSNAFGFYCAVGLLGLLLFAPSFWTFRGRFGPFAARILTWLTAITVMVQGLIFSQGRSVWLACLIVFPPFLITGVAGWVKGAGGRVGKRAVWFAILGIVFASTITVVNRDIILQRVNTDRHSFRAIASGDLNDLPFSSIKVRVDAWRLGLEKWLERPLLGWGPGTSSRLLEESNIDSVLRGSGKGEVMKNFHNSYLEILVGVGLAGALFFAVALWLVCKSAWRSFCSGWLRRDVFLFTMGALAIFLIASAANLRTGDHFGRFYLALFGGIAYSYRLSRPTKIRADADPEEKEEAG